jgi:putative resolvase
LCLTAVTGDDKLSFGAWYREGGRAAMSQPAGPGAAGLIRWFCLVQRELSDTAEMMAGVKVSEWARANGVSRQSATRWLHSGVLLVPAGQLATGTILVVVPGRAATGVAICARVSSCGLDRQVAQLAECLTADGLAPAKIVSEVGSGLFGCCARLLGVLRDAWVGTVVAGHRACRARVGVEYLEAALAARGRKVIVVGRAEVSDDVGRDMVEVLTSFCARLYGRWSAKHRAEFALAAARSAGAA